MYVFLLVAIVLGLVWLYSIHRLLKMGIKLKPQEVVDDLLKSMNIKVQ